MSIYLLDTIATAIALAGGTLEREEPAEPTAFGAPVILLRGDDRIDMNPQPRPRPKPQQWPGPTVHDLERLRRAEMKRARKAARLSALTNKESA